MKKKFLAVIAMMIILGFASCQSSKDYILEVEESLMLTVTSTPEPTATSTPVPTATPTPTSTPVPTATSTPEPTATSTPVPTATNTPVPTATSTPVPTATPAPTSTPEPTVTNIPEPTATSTPEPTATSTPVSMLTSTPVPTATNTPTPVPKTIAETTDIKKTTFTVPYVGGTNIIANMRIKEYNASRPTVKIDEDNFFALLTCGWKNEAGNYNILPDGWDVKWYLDDVASTYIKLNQAYGGDYGNKEAEIVIKPDLPYNSEEIEGYVYADLIASDGSKVTTLKLLVMIDATSAKKIQTTEESERDVLVETSTNIGKDEDETYRYVENSDGIYIYRIDTLTKQVTIYGLEDEYFVWGGTWIDLIIPSEIEGYPVTSLADWAFMNTSVVSAEIPSSIMYYGKGLFNNCSYLETVILPEEMPYISEDMFSGTSLKEIEIPKGVTNIGNYAFGGCEDLEKVIIPKGLEIIGVDAFALCSALREINLEYVRIIDEGAFWFCSSLEEIDLRKTESIERGAFVGCNLLKSVGETENLTTIGESAFSGCSSLEKIDLRKVKNIEKCAFSDCNLLKSVGETENLAIIGERAFLGCSSLEEINLWNAKRIEKSAFSGCKNLRVPLNIETIEYLGTDSLKTTNMLWNFLDEDKLINVYEGSDKKIIKRVTEIIRTELELDLGDQRENIVRSVHDWLVINTSYSKAKYDDYVSKGMGDIEIVLEKHFAICHAYSVTFDYFMQYFDIPCEYISSDEMDHAWNMVLMDDGYWYHVDITWDDPGSNDEEWETGWLRYSNLLRNDEGIKTTGHYGWKSDIIADGIYYEENVYRPAEIKLGE